MPESTAPHRLRLVPATTLLLLAAVVAACGGAAGSPDSSDPATPSEAVDATEAVAGTEVPAATDAAGSTSALASILPADVVSAALGETVTPECETSVLTGAGSCVWTAADGSWLKVEDGDSPETPDLASFSQRMTATLGLDEAVDGLGEAAYLGTSSRGTRIAVFLGEGRVAWVVLNRQGDAATQATQVKDMARMLIEGM
jgi:hypothetical protein